ncbi:hypothetical protein ACFVRD_49050 [Streptomyces sp. NPDC057908]|uniref:hypothetical protein n=1 Tax=Streptomyces sp. NPDC057908 TaxID=3346276 RepID=UPI0036E1D716
MELSRDRLAEEVVARCRNDFVEPPAPAAVALCAATVALTLGSAGFANAEAWIFPRQCLDGGGQVVQIEPGLGNCVGGTYDGTEVRERA